jgi:branched-chain amino acid transport system substrate-binding protein
MNKKTVWFSIIVALLIIFGSLYFNRNIKSESGTIKIGGLFALTGKWQVGGETEANFAKIAVNEINANGGILGKPIEFILEDDKCSAKDALSAAQKLVEQDGVDIILGPSCTPASQAVVPYTNDRKKIIIAFTTSADNIFDKYFYAFRAIPPGDTFGKVGARVAGVKYNKKNVAVITETTDFARAWSKSFKESFVDLGGSVVYDEEYLTGNTDFKSMITKLLQTKPDVVYLATQAPQDTGLIIRQMKELGVLERFQITGNANLINKETLNIAGFVPENAFGVAITSKSGDTMNELVAKYKQIYGKEIGFDFFYTAAAYDMVYLLKEAIEKCGKVDTKCVSEYLYKVEGHEGKVTNWSFNEFGDAQVPLVNYKESSFKNSKIIYSDIK